MVKVFLLLLVLASAYGSGRGCDWLDVFSTHNDALIHETIMQCDVVKPIDGAFFHGATPIFFAIFRAPQFVERMLAKAKFSIGEEWHLVHPNAKWNPLHAIAYNPHYVPPTLFSALINNHPEWTLQRDKWRRTPLEVLHYYATMSYDPRRPIYDEIAKIFEFAEHAHKFSQAWPIATE